MLVRDLRQSFDVGDIPRGIAHTFAVDRPGVFIDELVYIFGTITRREAGANSALGKDVLQQSESGAIELWQRNDVVARLANIDQ